MLSLSSTPVTSPLLVLTLQGEPEQLLKKLRISLGQAQDTISSAGGGQLPSFLEFSPDLQIAAYSIIGSRRKAKMKTAAQLSRRRESPCCTETRHSPQPI